MEFDLYLVQDTIGERATFYMLVPTNSKPPTSDTIIFEFLGRGAFAMLGERVDASES